MLLLKQKRTNYSFFYADIAIIYIYRIVSCFIKNLCTYQPGLIIHDLGLGLIFCGSCYHFMFHLFVVYYAYAEV